MTKEIKLTRDCVALVDDQDFEWLNQWKWRFDGHYAVRTLSSFPKKNIRMHTQIMNTPKGLVVDHINHNKLDNRRENLRVCTQQENAQNVPDYITNTTGAKNVYFKKQTGRWFSQLMVAGKVFHLGYFDTKQEAIEAKNQWQRQH